MKKSNLFGASNIELDAAKSVIENLIGFVLEEHESDYRGGGYFRVELSDARLMLQKNFMEDDGEVTEAAYPDSNVLLYLDGEAAEVEATSALLMAGLNSFKLLRSCSF